MTPDGIFNEIAETVASARAMALMGDPARARDLLRTARLQFLKHRATLRDFPGAVALEHSLQTAGSAIENQETAAGR